MSDAKLYNRDAMGHIDARHRRFLTVMPATRAEVGELRRFIATTTPVWTEVPRRPGRGRGDCDVVVVATPAPSQAREGHRVVWIRSSENGGGGL